MDKINRQVRKYKEKMRQHKPRQPIKENNKVIMNMFMAGEQKEEGEEFSPWWVIKTGKLSIQPMSLDEAIMQMDLFGENCFVFTNAASDALSISTDAQMTGWC